MTKLQNGGLAALQAELEETHPSEIKGYPKLSEFHIDNTFSRSASKS